MNEFREKTEELQRALIAEKLAQCTAEQQSFFHRLYPEGIPAASLENAFNLCERTIKKNQAKAERVTEIDYSGAGCDSYGAIE